MGAWKLPVVLKRVVPSEEKFLVFAEVVIPGYEDGVAGGLCLAGGDEGRKLTVYGLFVARREGGLKLDVI